MFIPNTHILVVGSDVNYQNKTQMVRCEFGYNEENTKQLVQMFIKIYVCTCIYIPIVTNRQQRTVDLSSVMLVRSWRKQMCFIKHTRICSSDQLEPSKEGKYSFSRIQLRPDMRSIYVFEVRCHATEATHKIKYYTNGDFSSNSVTLIQIHSYQSTSTYHTQYSEITVYTVANIHITIQLTLYYNTVNAILQYS